MRRYRARITARREGQEERDRLTGRLRRDRADEQEEEETEKEPDEETGDPRFHLPAFLCLPFSAVFANARQRETASRGPSNARPRIRGWLVTNSRFSGKRCLLPGGTK